MINHSTGSTIVTAPQFVMVHRSKKHYFNHFSSLYEIFPCDGLRFLPFKVSNEMRINLKKLAIDFDGTIAHTNQMKSNVIKERYGLKIPHWQCERILCIPQIGEDAYNEIADMVYERDLTLRIVPIPGAIEYIQKLAQKAELYLLTARPAKRLDFAKEWLENQQIIDCFKGFLSSHAKEQSWRLKLAVCQENGLDLLIDDEQQHFYKNGFTGIKKVLIKIDYREQIPVPPETRLVKSWEEFYTYCLKHVL